jgi:hypothetical protein
MYKRSPLNVQTYQQCNRHALIFCLLTQWGGGGLPCGRKGIGLQYRGRERVELYILFPIMPSRCAYGQLGLWVFVGAFAISRKAIISFVTSVRPSVRTEQLDSHWTDFSDILLSNICLFVCLFSCRYNPLWLYFHRPVAGFSLLVFEDSWSHTTTRHSR